MYLSRGLGTGPLTAKLPASRPAASPSMFSRHGTPAGVPCNRRGPEFELVQQHGFLVPTFTTLSHPCRTIRLPSAIGQSCCVRLCGHWSRSILLWQRDTSYG